MIEASKGLSLIYKYLKDDKIAFKDEYKKLNATDFELIKIDCGRYEGSRDSMGIVCGSTSTNYYNPRTNTKYIFSYPNRDIIEIANRTLNIVTTFQNYDNSMLNVARSIIEYNSDNFIRCISRYYISIDDVQNFLSIINEAKTKDNIDLRLLYSSSELIDQFYNLSIKCKEYFGYGDFKSVINKLEQLYTFEKEKLDNLLNSKIKR